VSHLAGLVGPPAGEVGKGIQARMRARRLNVRSWLKFQTALRLLLAALLAVPAPSVADEVQSLTSTQDATIRQGSPTTSDGTTTTLKSLSETSNNGRFLVKFDLAGNIDAGSAVKNSSLKLQLLTAPNQSRSHSAHMVTGSTNWTESGTWNTRDGVTAWSTAGGDFNAGAASTQSSGTTANTQIAWPILSDGTVSNIPQFWLDTPAQNQGLIIKDATEDATPRAVVKQVLSGTEQFTSANCPTGSCTRTTTMGSSVDTSKSFLIFQVRNSCTRPQCSAIRGELNTAPTVNNQIFFTKSSNETSTVDVQWYVVEFEQGVQVIHGQTDQNLTTENVAIPAITGVSSTSQMFVLTSKTVTSTDNNMNADDPIIAEMTTTTNLQIRCDATSPSHVIGYQVVAFTNPLDINVQKGTVPLFGTAGQTQTETATSLASAVDTDKAFVLLNARGSGTFGGNDVGSRMLEAVLGTGGSLASFAACGTTCDTIKVTRSIFGSPDTFTEIFYQVVEIRNKSRIAAAEDALPATVVVPQSITSASTSLLDGFTISRSVPHASTQYIGGGQYMGRSANSSNQGLGTGAFTLALSSGGGSTVNLTITRNSVSSTGVLSWYVTEWTDQRADEARYGAREDGTASNRPRLDVSFLRNVSLSSVTAGISEVTFVWAYPTGTDRSNYNGVTILRTQGATAPAFVPADGTSYTVGQTVAAGEFVAAQTSEPSNSGGFTITTVTDENGPDNVVLPSTQYSFKIFNRDAVNFSSLVTPPTAPPRYSSGVSSTITTGAPGGVNKLWSYRTGAATLAPPGIDPGNSVIVGSNDNIVHSMSVTDGGRRYQPGGAVGTTGGAIQSRPPVIPAADTTGVDCDTVTGGVQPCDVTFVGAADGKVYAFNASTGAKLWESAVLTLGGGTIQGAPSVQLKLYSNGAFTPTVDLVFVGTRNAGGASATDNRVYALNANDGSIVWTFNAGGGSNVDLISSTGAVDYSANAVWFTSRSNGGTQNSLWKLNTNDGSLLDSHLLGDIDGSPTINTDGKVVYAVTNSGSLVLVRTDIASCTASLGAGSGSGVGFPIPISTGSGAENVYFSTATTLNKFAVTYNPSAVACGSETITNLNGSTWTNPALSSPSTPIVNLANVSFPFYVGDSSGRLNKIDAATGAILASRDVNLLATIGDPSIDLVLGRLIVGDTTGRVYAFDVF
jgi:outer membrane protein assembly factor BamB